MTNKRPTFNKFKNIHIYLFLKCGIINSYLTVLISNYLNYKNITSFEMDFIILYYLKKKKCYSSTINYNNYKFCSCFSFENIICHGIPIKIKIFFNFVKIDISIRIKKYFSDNCINLYLVKKKFFYFLKYFFYSIIKNISFLTYYKDIYNLMNIFNKKLKIVKEYCSHGIFQKLHNNLIIYHNKNYINKKIKKFDSFTIEPMIVYGENKNSTYKNIFLSKLNFFSFQWEHTLYILYKKNILTTLRKNEICYIIL